MFNFFKKKSKIKELPQKAVNVANSSDVSDLPSVASDLPSVAPVSSACEIEHDYRSDFKKCEHKLINFKSEKIKLSNFSKNSTQENLSYVSVGDFVKICHLKGKEGYWVVSEGGGIGDEIGKIPERLNPLIWQAPVIASFLYNSDCADSGKEVPTIEVFLDMPKNEDTPRVSLNNYFYTLKNLKKYVVFDIETTGLSYLTDEIIEIGLLKVENGEIIDKFSKLVNPNRRISDFINNLTGITNEDLKKAPSMNEIAKEVYDFLNGYVVVGHNVTFDLKFLKYAFCENKISAQIEYFDTLSLARELYPNFANHKLETLIKSLNISDSQTHRALDDVLNTNAVFEKLKAEKIKQIEEEQAKKKAEKAEREREFEEKYGLSPIFKKGFCFTGVFENERAELEQAVADNGGVLKEKVNKNCSFLVKGDVAPLPQWAKERKLLKAEELSKNGVKIEIITEEQFINLINQAKIILKK